MIRNIALKILSVPCLFDLYQWVVGAPACHRYFICDIVQAKTGQRILDVGCGVGASLKYLPTGVEYVGVDISQAYIIKAQQNYAARGKFLCVDVTSESADSYGQFDVAYAFGVLHHLNDI